jgi:hypothetical protein
MPIPTWDVFIGLAFLVGVAYSFLLRREKAITTLCSVYIGMVIASSFSETVYKFFNGNATIANSVWIKSNASVSTIAIVLFLLSIFLISGAIISSASKAGDVSPVEVIVYGILTVALIVSSILGFLAPETRTHIMDASRVAKILYNERTLIVVAAPLILVLLNMRRK